jgi:hypothetical protein
MRETAHFIDQGGSGFDKPLPHEMQNLEVLLLQLFDGTKRMVGRVTASQTASAARESCFGDVI